MNGFNLSRWAIEHPALVRFLMVSLLVLGVSSYFQLGQDEDPPFNFRVMVIQAYWPGATATQVADQLTDRIERTLQNVPDTYSIMSFSKPGQTTIIFQVKDDFNPDEVPDRFYAARKLVGDMAHTLPQGVRGPFFNDDFGDTYGVIYTLSAPGYSAAEVTDFSRSIRSQLLQVKDVGKVDVFGLQEERIYLELSRKQLARYGLNSVGVAQQIADQNAVVDAGRVTTETFSLPIRVPAQFQSVDDIAHMPIRAGGLLIRLSDIATVRRATVDPPSQLLHVNGEPVVGLGVSMQKGGDVIALGGALRAALAGITSELPIGVTLRQVQDQPTVVATSVNEFLIVLAEAVAIVLAVSLLALGIHTKPFRIDPRPGLIVAISIPLVMAVTFLIMKAWGVGIHKISLGSLIIALGLLVDDAIIVVEMMVRKMEEGADRMRAATAAFELTAMPMLTGTLITAVGFLPIGIAKSVVGEYTFAIFAVTAAALMVSWVVSVFFVPVLGYWLLKSPNRTPSLERRGVSPADETAMAVAEDELFKTPFYQRFRQAVTWCVFNPGQTLLATLLVFVLGVVGMGRVEQQFFPDSSRPEILIDVYLAEGASILATRDAVERIEKQASQTEGVQTVTSWIGSGAPRFFLPLDIIFPQSNVAQLIIQPKEGASRAAILKSLQEQIPVLAPEARLRVKLLPNGPPVPYPVAFRLISERPEQAIKAAALVESVMRTHPNLEGVHNNWNEKRPVAQLTLDLGRARELGVGASAVARTLEARFAGVSVGEFRENDKVIPIELRLPAAERDGLRDLRGLLVPSASGQQVPLEKIAKVELVWEHGMIWRRDRQYAVTVQGALKPGKQAPTVSSEVAEMLEPLKAKFPPGVRLEVGGEVEESSKGQSSIFAGMPIMLFITLTLLVIQLKSTPKSLMVLATAPLGIAGVAGALLLLGRPFGFVAMLGFIALMGMIMRNSVILIDQIEKERARGLGFNESIIEATVARFRPITLTAAAAVLAMIPLQGSVFWGPMAVAIMGGLVVATALTLLSLPALCAFRPQWSVFGAVSWGKPWGKH
ncbi:MAG: efflux RND transporter permease subunit [Betaproteobacteria bacterium]|nr:efflux RND transporter permease subunit [Betaproteobacteria bacterium]